MNPRTAKEEHVLGIMSPHICSVVHAQWHRTVGLQLGCCVVKKCKETSRQVDWLWMVGVCALQRVNRAKRLFKPVQNYWQKAGANNSTFLCSSCLSREGCTNDVYIYFWYQHMYPFFGNAGERGIPTLVVLHFIFQNDSSLSWQKASGTFKNHFSPAAF